MIVSDQQYNTCNYMLLSTIVNCSEPVTKTTAHAPLCVCTHHSLHFGSQVVLRYSAHSFRFDPGSRQRLGDRGSVLSLTLAEIIGL